MTSPTSYRTLPRPSRRAAARAISMRRALRSKPSSGERGMRARVVEREEPEAAAQVEHPPARRQVLADLVEEPLAQDPEAPPAVRAHDRIVVGADDATNRFASHRSGIPGPSRPGGTRARAFAQLGERVQATVAGIGPALLEHHHRGGRPGSRPATSSARSGADARVAHIVEEVEVVDEARGLPQPRDGTARGCRRTWCPSPARWRRAARAGPDRASGPPTRRAFSAIHGASRASTPFAPSTTTSNAQTASAMGRRAPNRSRTRGPSARRHESGPPGPARS